jgi:hypothetical protein
LTAARRRRPALPRPPPRPPQPRAAPPAQQQRPAARPPPAPRAPARAPAPELRDAFPTVAELVGGTPIVRLQHLPGNTSNIILAKLEGHNPAGSAKDRPALHMLSEAERRGAIKKGDTIIEATSGNTGIALAMAAAIKGAPAGEELGGAGLRGKRDAAAGGRPSRPRAPAGWARQAAGGGRRCSGAAAGAVTPRAPLFSMPPPSQATSSS